MLRTQWMQMCCKVPRIHWPIQYFDRSIPGTQSIAAVQLLFHWNLHWFHRPFYGAPHHPQQFGHQFHLQKNNSINGSAETKCVILTFIQHRLQNNLRLLNLQHAITCTGLQKRTMCICVIAFRHFFRFFLLWIANKNHQSIQTVWYWMRNVYEMSTTK